MDKIGTVLKGANCWEVAIQNKVNELVEGYGEIIARVERVTTAYHDLRERLDKHIDKDIATYDFVMKKKII